MRSDSRWHNAKSRGRDRRGREACPKDRSARAAHEVAARSRRAAPKSPTRRLADTGGAEPVATHPPRPGTTSGGDSASSGHEIR